MQVDAQMSKDRQIFYDASLQYVFKIQEVQERKKFEFVEPVRFNSYTGRVSFERCKDSSKSFVSICFYLTSEEKYSLHTVSQPVLTHKQFLADCKPVL